MMLNWEELLGARGITFVRSSRSNIETRCPFCADDPSHHLSISLEGKGWRCWRNPADHYGRSPVRLLMALFRIDEATAREMVGAPRQVPDDYFNRICNLLSPTQTKDRGRDIELPYEFERFRSYKSTSHIAFPVSAWPFVSYLKDEARGGFRDIQIANFTTNYDIYYCRGGAYKARIIFVIQEAGKVICWTGRSIDGSLPRYKTLSTNEEKACGEGYQAAKEGIGSTLLWFDSLLRATSRDTLYLCEGPFDALKLRTLGAYATCFFTQVPNEKQIALLHQVVPLFKATYLLLDQGTLHHALRTQSRLMGLNVGIKVLPPQIKDPCLLKSLDSLA